MKIIWSYCSFGGKRLPDDFTVKMATLSLLSMKCVTHYKTELWTDAKSLEYFQHLNYNSIVVTRFDGWEDERYWNIPKMFVYSKQEEPFLHVDFDTCFLIGFRVPTEGDVITEKMRQLPDGRERWCMMRFKDENLPSVDEIICSGLIGGNNYEGLFRDNYVASLEKTADTRDEVVTYDVLPSYEEYLFTQRVVSSGRTVQSLYNGSYLHFWCRRDATLSKQDIYEAVINELLEFYKNYDLELRRADGRSGTVRHKD